MGPQQEASWEASKKLLGRPARGFLGGQQEASWEASKRLLGRPAKGFVDVSRDLKGLIFMRSFRQDVFVLLLHLVFRTRGS